MFGENRRGVSQARDGFTLIEVLVSLVVLSLALGLLVRIFSTGAGNARLADDYAIATALAESTLTRVGASSALEAGRAAGAYDARFEWVIDVTPYSISDAEPDGSAFVAEADENERASYQITVSVSWEDRGALRSVSLTSLRAVENR